MFMLRCDYLNTHMRRQSDRNVDVSSLARK